VCADLVRIWQSEKKTILFVTHDIEEAIQLADRVLVMSNRPAIIQEEQLSRNSFAPHWRSNSGTSML
jgi:ABC-type nitrate/sulfonate/bicarbonate transport system ATPase subunit